MAGTDRGNIAAEIRGISAADELGQSFLPYSLSVITARALPDVRDGLKPVQRRILVAMNDMGLRPANPHKKSAKVVGETMGNYHPHGDSAIYEALVRLGQTFSMRLPLIDPHGNFGSPDDPPAAPRYTECRLAAAAVDLLAEIDEGTVEYRPTYDGEGTEPECLPARLPNLLVNGSSGIAVGMATNMPPHNLREVCEALKRVLRHPDRRPPLDRLLAVLPGPDFPTGGQVVDDGGLRDAYENGRGTIRVRAVADIVQLTARRQGIVITELPYAVGPERVIGRIKDLVLSGKLAAISDVKNLTDRRSGMRIQIEVKTGTDPRAVLTELYRLTPMEETFGINNVALVNGVPTTLGLVDLCRYFLDHRFDVIVRRSQHRLDKAKTRAHILEGLLIALDHIDEVIRIIRGSRDVGVAREALQSELGLSEIQATAILDMQLRRLTALEKERIEEELAELHAQIADLEDILASQDRRRTIIEAELVELVGRLATPRRTRILSAEEAPRFTAQTAPQSLELGDDPCIVTLTCSGLVGRELDGGTPAGTKLGRHDVLLAEVQVSNRQTVLAVTDRARCLPVTAYEVPEVAGRSRGAAAAELFPVERGERVLALFRTTIDNPLVLITRAGVAKRISPEELSTTKAGSVLLTLDDKDELVAAFEASPEADVVIVTSDARALRTASEAISVQGRAARGVAGVKLRGGARVIAAGLADPDNGMVLTATDGDVVKLTAVSEIPTQGRGSGGVRLTRFRGFETQLWLGAVAPTADIWCLFGQDEDPAKLDPQPGALRVEPTWRDGLGVKGPRVLAAGKARW